MSTEARPSLPQPEDSPLQKETSLDLISHHIVAARRMLEVPSKLTEAQEAFNSDTRTRLTVWNEYSDLEAKVLREIRQKLAAISILDTEAMQDLASEETIYMKVFDIEDEPRSDDYRHLSNHLSWSIGEDIRRRLHDAHLPETTSFAHKVMVELSMTQVCSRALARVRTERDRAIPHDGEPSLELKLIQTSFSRWYLKNDGNVSATNLSIGLEQPIIR